MFNAAVSAKNADPFGNNEVCIDGNGDAVNSNEDAIDANEVFFPTSYLRLRSQHLKKCGCLIRENLAIDGREDMLSRYEDASEGMKERSRATTISPFWRVNCPLYVDLARAGQVASAFRER